MDEKTMLENAAFFIVCYAPWLLKSYLVDKPYNELSAFKSALDIKDQYPNLGQALFVRMQRHSWYLSEQLVLLSLSDDDIEEKLKSDKEKRLLTVLADQFPNQEA